MPYSTPPWCRACGADGMGSHRCGVCGVPGDPPDPGPARVGGVVRIGSGPTAALCLAVAQTGDTVDLAVPGGRPTQIPADDFDRLRRIAVPGPTVIGAAGRIWAAAAAGPRGELRPGWSEAVAAAAARTLAEAGLGARRAAAIDRIALGAQPDPVAAGFGLSPAELAWYAAHRACLTEPAGVLLDRLERLPPHAYAARVSLLMARIGDLLRDPVSASRARAQAEPFASTSPDAAALVAALNAEPPRDIREALTAYLSRVVAELSAEEAARACSIGRVVLDLKADQPLPDPGLPTTRALALYLSGCAGTVLDDHVAVLARLPIELIDDLVEAGALTAASSADSAWPQTEAAYLQCRLDPGNASEEQLRGAGFTAELARRAYLAGDGAALAELPGDEATRHYLALRTWIDGSGECRLDGLRSAEKSLLSLISRLRQRIADTGAACEMPVEIAADPSCWPLLRREAATGNVMSDDLLRADYRHCASWLDLCKLEGLVYSGEWRAAAVLGATAAERAGPTAVGDELRNIAAAAALHVGDAAAGMKRLEPALAPHCADALLINAAIVAARHGSDAALPYLNRLAVEAGDERLRDAAVARAVDLWLADAGSPHYPDGLRDLVRSTLARPRPDGLLWRLLRLSHAHDRAWLADGGRVEASDHAATAVGYWRARARAIPGDGESLVEVARLLGDLSRRTPPPPWLPGELAWLSDLVDEAVHRPFGEPEAIAYAPVVRVLADACALPPDRQLYLPAQIGAHLAVHADGQRRCLAPDAERDLIFQPCEGFLAGRPGLDDRRRARTATELTRCLTVAAGALVRETDRRFTATAQPWVESLRRSAESRSGAAESRARLRRLIGPLEALITRLGVYGRLLDRMPPADGDPGDFRRRLAEAADSWSADLAHMRASS